MTPDGSSRVLIVRAGDLVRVCADEPPTRDLLSSALELPGGVLFFDVTAPDRAPTADLDDPDAAAAWIARVYGADVLAAVQAHAAAASDLDANGDDEPTALDAPATADRARLARIALGQWLWRYWPDDPDVHPLDPDLLRIELAALAWDADDCFGARQPAGILLGGVLDALERAADALRTRLADDPSARATPVARAVLGAVDALVAGEASAAADASPALLDRLDAVLEAAVAAEAADGARVEEWLGSVSSAPFGSQDDFALAAGDFDHDDAGVGAHAGRTGVDWSQVPPRSVGWDEDAVRWTAEPAGPGSWRVTVRVKAASSGSADLLARAYLPDGSAASMLPVLVVPLERAGEDYCGAGVVRALDPSGLVVDVYDVGSVHAPRVSAESRRSGTADRAAARALIRDRAGSAVQDGPAALFEAERRRL